MPSRRATAIEPLHPIPQKASLVDQAVVALRQRFESGEFGGILPGEHTLRTELQIGRGTLRLALGILTASGDLLPAAQGQRRRIAAKARVKEKRNRRISILLSRPFEELPVGDRSMFRKLIDRIESAGWQSRYHVMPPGSARSAGSRLKKLLSGTNPDFCVAFDAQTDMLRLFLDGKIPVIGLMSRNCPGVPRVAYDLNGALRHAANNLLRSGLRNLVVPPAHSAAPHARMVLEKLHGEWGVPFDAERVMPVFDGSRDGLVKLMAQLYKRACPPDAMVIYDPLLLVTLQGWLASRGLRIPADLSVIAINHDPLLDAIYPGVPHYAAPANLIVGAVHRKIASYFETGNIAAEDHLIPMKFIPSP